jgi:hypothetical protein
MAVVTLLAFGALARFPDIIVSWTEGSDLPFLWALPPLHIIMMYLSSFFLSGLSSHVLSYEGIKSMFRH